MSYQFHRLWLTKKFTEIQTRIIKAVDQLSDEQLNWSPDEYSHTIAILLKHIEGNVKERIVKGICQQDIVRDRDQEFSRQPMSRQEAKALIERNMQTIIALLSELSDDQLQQVQLVRGKPRTHLDMLHQCAAHYSEHMGQIFYIAKQQLQERYTSTSI